MQSFIIIGLCYELSGDASLRDMCLEQAYKLSPGGKKKTYIVISKGSGKNKGATDKRTAPAVIDQVNDSGDQLQQQSQTISDKTAMGDQTIGVCIYVYKVHVHVCVPWWFNG